MSFIILYIYCDNDESCFSLWPFEYFLADFVSPSKLLIQLNLFMMDPVRGIKTRKLTEINDASAIYFVVSMEERALKHLQCPSTQEELNTIKSKFEKIHRFPNCCGVIMLLTSQSVYLDPKIRVTCGLITKTITAILTWNSTT